MNQLPARKRQREVVVREFEEQSETAVLTVSTGQVVVLNSTLAAIWYLCDGTRSAGEIAHEICTTVPGADPSQVAADVVRALADLARWDLLE
jgi:hypothetical protein